MIHRLGTPDRQRSGIAVAFLALAVGSGLAVPSKALASGPSLSARVEAELSAYVRGKAEAGVTEITIPDLADFDVAGVDPARAEIRFSVHSRTKWNGSVPVTVVVADAGKERKRGVVAVRLASNRSAWASTRRIRRGEPVGPADLERVDVDARRLPEDALFDPSATTGRVSTRNIAEGAVIRTSWLDTPPAVTRGETVRIRFASGAMKIEARGRVREDARIGDWVRVVNTDSRRELFGQVGADGAIHVGH